MKRLSIILVSFFICAVSAYALTTAELQGKWVSKSFTVDKEDNVKSEIELIFNGEKVSHKAKMNFSEEDEGIKMYVYCEIMLDGNYTVAGDSITVNYDASTLKVKCTEDDVRVVGIDNPAIVAQLQSQMSEMIRKEMLSAERDELEDPDVYNNVMIVGKKMTCVSDGDVLTFKKK